MDKLIPGSDSLNTSQATTARKNKFGKTTEFLRQPSLAMIRRTIRLMVQFEGHWKNEFENGRSNSTTEDETGSENVPEVAGGVTCEGFTQVMNAFKEYFELQLVAPKRNSTLSNDLIRMHIFGYLPMEDVTNCRLVSKSWNLSAVQYFRCRHERINLTSKNLTRLIPILENSPMIPFTKFKLLLNPDCLSGCFDITYFFTKFGEFVNVLTIEGTDDDLCSDFEKIFRLALANVPNLEFLNLSKVPLSILSHSSHPQQLHPDLEGVNLLQVHTLKVFRLTSVSSEFSEMLLGLIPKVETLQLHIDSDADCIAFTAALKATKKLARLETITTSKAAWDNLTEQKHALKLVTMLAWCSNVRENCSIEHERFLKGQTDSLEELSLAAVAVDADANQRTIQVPHMIKLSKIKLLHVNGCRFEALLKPLNPKHLPGLITVTGCWECIGNVYGSSSVFESVEELRIYQSGSEANRLGRPSDEHMEKVRGMGRIFPNLIKFTSHEKRVFYQFLECLFLQFPKLEELDLDFTDATSGGDVNCLLGGLESKSDYIWKRVLGQKLSPNFENLWLPLVFHPDHIKPSLRDLKCLKKLRIKYSSTSKNTISDISIYATFLQMSALAQLTLEGSVSISEEGAAKLAEHHSNVIIIPA